MFNSKRSAINNEANLRLLGLKEFASDTQTSAPRRGLPAAMAIALAALLASAFLSGIAIAQTCSVPGNAGPVTIATVPNTYFPGAVSAATGATSITLGTLNAAGNTTTISPGDLLLVIQMQGAVINSTATNNYGDGAGTGAVQDNTGDPARGSTSNTAGIYEFVVATSAAGSGATVNLASPLQNGYVNAATVGASRFQVIRVPQYSALTVNATIAVTPWDGTSGGVIAVDVAGTLQFNGGTGFDGAGRGFRGGGGFGQQQIDCGNNQCPDYRVANADPANGAFKGEGIAGTPALVYSSAANAVTGNGTGADGYPNGDRARGAPGNAGGGGNQHNAGGGGGGNGGIGGIGGNTFNQFVSGGTGGRYGGFGGAAGYNSATRLIMGGGGGAGDHNNSTLGATTQGSGGSGGALVMIRAGTIAGNGTINVNGGAGVTAPGTDATGGGGAGGTVWISTASGNAAVTVKALGGIGANSGDMNGSLETDGPGGGGGGGQLLSNATGITFTSTGGAAGTVTNTTNTGCGTAASGNPTCFATVGATGTSTTVVVPVAGTGVRTGPECLPDLRVSKATTTPLIATAAATTAAYSILVENFGGGARNVAILDTTLPPNWTLAAAPTYTYAPVQPLAANQLSSGAEASNTAGGASFPLAATPGTVPANGSNSLTWRQFFLPPVKAGVQSSVRINMTVNIPTTAAVGCYHNGAGFTFLDPTRTTASGNREMTPSTNNGANRTGVVYSANSVYIGGTGGAALGNNYNGQVAGPTAEDVCLQPDLSVAKTGPAGPIAAGTSFAYNLTGRNNGRAINNLTYANDQTTPVTNGGTGTVLTGGIVRLTDTVPTGLTIGAITPPVNWACSTAGQAITCDYTPPTLPVAATTDLPGPIVVNVTPTAAACPGPVSNTAVVVTTAAPYTESNTANNTTAAVSTTFSCTTNLAITKTDGKTSTIAGGSNTYTIVVTNAGGASADGALLKDPAVPGLSCTTPPTCAVTTGAAVCPAGAQLTVANLQGAGIAIPTLPANSSLTFTLTCGVTATGS